MNKKYDLIFSIGEACSCTQTLRSLNMQEYSYPFDWLYGSTFLGRCKILADKFKNFINKEDLEFSHSVRNINCSAYYNISNDLTFNHDFLKDIPFDKMYTVVKEKYDRRISRLFDKINQANDILIVYIEVPRKQHVLVSNQEIIEGFNLIKNSTTFNSKNLNLLCVSNNSEKQENIQINENIQKITCDYKNYKAKEDYEINKKALKKHLKQYSLKTPFIKRAKKLIIKVLIELIPIKSVKAKLRKKHHIGQ